MHHSNPTFLFIRFLRHDITMVYSNQLFKSTLEIGISWSGASLWRLKLIAIMRRPRIRDVFPQIIVTRITHSWKHSGTRFHSGSLDNCVLQSSSEWLQNFLNFYTLVSCLYIIDQAWTIKKFVFHWIVMLRNVWLCLIIANQIIILYWSLATCCNIYKW